MREMAKGVFLGVGVALLIALPARITFAQPALAQPSTSWANHAVSNPVTPSTLVTQVTQVIQVTQGSSESPDFIGPQIEPRNDVRTVEPSRSQVRVQVPVNRVALARTRTGAIRVAGAINAELYQWNFDQMGCLVDLWDHESNWNYKSVNRTSGAHGIAQALPAVKMSSVANDWRKNPVTQITWGLQYVESRYGNPCNALRHWQQRNWY